MPYQKPVLSLDDARKAMEAMLQEALKTPNRAVAIAICDDQGELVAFARMDKCAPLPLTVARKKAYTAARTRADTRAFAERLKNMGRSAVNLATPICWRYRAALPSPLRTGVRWEESVSAVWLPKRTKLSPGSD